MAYRELEVQERSVRGSSAMNQLRKAGMIPGVVYGSGEEAKTIAVDAHDFLVLARKSTPTQLFRFKSKSTSLDGIISLVKTVQTEPMRETVLHVDFLAVHEGQRVNVAVPIQIVGESASVKEGRAVLNQTAYELEMECLPEAIPASLPVDVSSLGEGESIHACDVELPEGTVLRSNPGLTVVSTVGSKLTLEVEEEAVVPEEEGAPETPEGEAAKTETESSESSGE